MKNIKEQLAEMWGEFEERKSAEGNDPRFFSCNEAWELFYLSERIQELKPEFTTLSALELIERCCRYCNGPVNRNWFIGLVAEQLEQIE
ncbi:MAG: hypothetical protein KGZ74_12055 [Chitinophagaceae bacterium]|nr:hypothetical protein [Chitinophagaceae bacterium]